MMNKRTYTRTKEIREKISKSLKTYYETHPESHKRKPFSEEWKRNISLAKIGKKRGKNTQETNEKISKALKGKKKPSVAARIGPKHPLWKGGRKKSHGYIYITKPEHPFADKCSNIFEHRFIMEKHLGRYLIPEEVVHHKNGIKDDNRPENLILFPNNKAHMKFHYQIRKKALEYYFRHFGH